MGNRHVPDSSLDFGQRKDVFHQLGHFGACEIFDLRGKALHCAAQIAKAVGALGAFAFLVVPLAIFKALELVRFLFQFLFCALLIGSELFKGFRVCYFS